MHCVHFAVLLGRGARLAVNSHAIAGPNPAVGPDPGILCEEPSGIGGCKITGPGTISGFYEGIDVTAGKAQIAGMTLTGNTYGITAFGAPNSRLTLTGVVATANRYGIVTYGLLAHTVDASVNAEIGVYAGTARATDLTANGNGEVAVFSPGTARFTRLTATGNAGPGVASLFRLSLASSTITGNNGAGAGYDILGSAVQLRGGTTCGKSATLVLNCSALLQCTFGAGPTLGLCSGD
jgi:hypothetical protein